MGGLNVSDAAIDGEVQGPSARSSKYRGKLYLGELASFLSYACRTLDNSRWDVLAGCITPGKKQLLGCTNKTASSPLTTFIMRNWDGAFQFRPHTKVSRFVR